jgi:hypothetical protein
LNTNKLYYINKTILPYYLLLSYPLRMSDLN